MRRRAFLAVLLAPAVIARSRVSRAQGAASELYRATVVVTGQSEENRLPGFRLCFLDMLAKLSGDDRLLTDDRALQFAAEAASLVRSFSYRDLLEGIPIHDEQGTYDRPHYLTADFDPAAVDGVLAQLGRKPWLTLRPRLAIVLAVENPTARFVLSADADRGLDMRASLDAASAKTAMPVALPSLGDIASLGLDDPAAREDARRLADLTARVGADVPLTGSLVWSDEAMGWIASWRLAGKDGSRSWTARGISFDDAFRLGLRGAGRILSGNGSP